MENTNKPDYAAEDGDDPEAYEPVVVFKHVVSEGDEDGGAE